VVKEVYVYLVIMKLRCRIKMLIKYLLDVEREWEEDKESILVNATKGELAEAFARAPAEEGTDSKMINILLVFGNNGLNQDFVNKLDQTENVQIIIAETGKLALNYSKNRKIDLVVVSETLSDMTGTTFVKKLTMINPMINTAIVSNLSKKDFHEATEGLGVLMAIPQDAGANEACNLLEYQYKINNITS
jgi:CheY-like chemotaxis protein